jgi:hypothetical protein
MPELRRVIRSRKELTICMDGTFKAAGRRFQQAYMDVKNNKTCILNILISI